MKCIIQLDEKKIKNKESRALYREEEKITITAISHYSLCTKSMETIRRDFEVNKALHHFEGTVSGTKTLPR